jgi:predicted nucleotidyltransferase
MNQTQLLKKIKEKLEELYGSRFHGLVLYGSSARGESGGESDIDLLCLLDGPVRTADEIAPIVDSTYPLQLEYLDRIFHIYAVSVEDYENETSPLFIDVKKEGVLV